MEQGHRWIKEEQLQIIRHWFPKYMLWIGSAIVLIAAVLLIGAFRGYSPAGGETHPGEGTETLESEPNAGRTEAIIGQETEDSTGESVEAMTEELTEESTEAMTEEPTGESTEAMTEEPTEESTEAMTEEPTEKLTEEWTEIPTVAPTEAPTERPTEPPTEEETMYLPSLKSEMDFNGNGVDDYTDILLGARQDAINHPTYDGSWWASGYPPDDIGVCSDVIWRAFKYAGYCLKDMVDADILARREAYPLIERPEPPIDFRRVRNLRIFFEEYAVKLTLDIHAVQEWQPGDIVIFGNDRHIGIVSDIRDKDGIPYIIHNGGQDDREENYLVQEDSQTVTGHYRWDASLIPEDRLIPWTE